MFDPIYYPVRFRNFDYFSEVGQEDPAAVIASVLIIILIIIILAKFGSGKD